MAEGQTILKPVIIEGYIRKKVSLFDGRGRLVGQKSAASIASDILLLLLFYGNKFYTNFTV